MSLGGGEGVTLPNIFEIARKLVEKLTKVFSVTFLFLVTAVDQIVKTPFPPNGKCLGKSLASML